MYPGPADPDLGVFVAQMEQALRDRGHEIELAVLDRRAGGKRRYLELRRKVSAAERPDVVWAHFLVPAGLIASSVDAPLVVTAHGRDVRNVGTLPGVAALTRRVVRRASTVIAVSNYLRRELETKLPEARGKTEVVDSGVDLERFHPDAAADLAGDHLSRAGSRPAYLAVGSLTERKNVVRLADAFARLGSGSLTFVGDGPLRGALEGRERVHLAGRVPHDAVPGWLTAADVVCAPSLLEPFGQSILEAMACGRTVVATRLGGPAGVRLGGGRDPGRPARRGRAGACARGGGGPREPERRCARGRGRARRQASGGEGGADPGASCSRSASLTSMSGRIRSSTPASRATVRACS